MVNEADSYGTDLKIIDVLNDSGMVHNKYINFVILVVMCIGFRVVFNIALVTLCSGKRH